VTCPRCAKDIESDSTYCRFCGSAVVATTSRRLTRIPDAGRIAGVCAGLAAYFNTDVTVIRLLWVVLSIVPGMIIGGIVAYLAAWLLMPEGDVPFAPAATTKRLVRPTATRKVAGVCAGLAQFIGVDSTVVRLLWVILSIYPGAIVCGLLFYVIAWLIIPSDQGAHFEPLASTT
jgi:phage shock protein PspC (stress-responsive transcriptional regulator)